MVILVVLVKDDLELIAKEFAYILLIRWQKDISQVSYLIKMFDIWLDLI
jgi:hypothetical protein